jgi:hypothetical protein
MNAEVHGHFVLYYYGWETDIITTFFLNSFRFHIPNADVGAKEGLDNEFIKVLVLSSGSWIDWSTKRFVMSAKVLVKEMGIAELSISPCSKSFVVPFSFVKKLMSNNSTHSSEESE